MYNTVNHHTRKNGFNALKINPIINSPPSLFPLKLIRKVAVVGFVLVIGVALVSSSYNVINLR
jgi:hypothetical protein